VLAWAVVTRGFELEWSLPAAPLVAGLVGGALVAVAAGLAASARALARRPVEVLRDET
jgi:predicted lysophospholipase L1 biosynthesis ABC-type transport system permease subunit